MEIGNKKNVPLGRTSRGGKLLVELMQFTYFMIVITSMLLRSTHILSTAVVVTRHHCLR